MSTVTRKIGHNRGKPRLWLEGKVLLDAGFTHGTRWSLLPYEGGLCLEANPEGPRKVSGKPERPVIDISGASLGELGEANRVTLRIASGSITVELTK